VFGPNAAKSQLKSVILISRAKLLLIFLSVAKIDAVQAEYSAFETLHETDGLIETAKELNIAYVAYSPLGHGWLVDDFSYQSPDDFAPDDFRRSSKSSKPTIPLLYATCNNY
jgi:aryl-alcohol dehydrogenase-like predicted oxidoreductase